MHTTKSTTFITSPAIERVSIHFPKAVAASQSAQLETCAEHKAASRQNRFWAIAQPTVRSLGVSLHSLSHKPLGFVADRSARDFRFPTSFSNWL